MNFPPASRFFKFPLLILTVLALFLTAASPADSERIRCEDIQTVTGVESLDPARKGGFGAAAGR